jgi:hypothetical protein
MLWFLLVCGAPDHNMWGNAYWGAGLANLPCIGGALKTPI